MPRLLLGGARERFCSLKRCMLTDLSPFLPFQPTELFRLLIWRNLLRPLRVGLGARLWLGPAWM
jgi:hypothetical protein